MKKGRKKWIVIGAVVLVIAAAAVIAVTSVQSSMNQLISETIEDVDLTQIPDGVYQGSSSVPLVSAKVEVTVKDHVITGIDLIEHKNGKGAAANAIPGMVVDAQSLSVDTVSGATCSSKVILKAIKDALTMP